MNFRLINQSLVVNTRVRRTAGCVSMLSALRAISRKSLLGPRQHWVRTHRIPSVKIPILSWELAVPAKNRDGPSLLLPDLEGTCFFPVAGRQRYSPNVVWLYQFNAAEQRVLRIDINHPSRGTLTRQVDANRDSHSTTQSSRGCDQRSMKVDHDGLALACPTLCTILDGNYHL
jgi:hypothetical protein